MTFITRPRGRAAPLPRSLAPTPEQIEAAEFATRIIDATEHRPCDRDHLIDVETAFLLATARRTGRPIADVAATFLPKDASLRQERIAGRREAAGRREMEMVA